MSENAVPIKYGLYEIELCGVTLNWTKKINILPDEIHWLISVVYKKLWNLDRWMGRMKSGISIS